MDICFECQRDCTRTKFENVEYVETGYSKDKGRITKFWYIYTSDGTTHALKYRDNEFYWART